jgi:hypothetical protein
MPVMWSGDSPVRPEMRRSLNHMSGPSSIINERTVFATIGAAP